jgi:hypothetical protein
MSYRLAFFKTLAVIGLGDPFFYQAPFPRRLSIKPGRFVKPVAPARPFIPDKKLAIEHEVVGTDEQVHTAPPLSLAAVIIASKVG